MTARARAARSTYVVLGVFSIDRALPDRRRSLLLGAAPHATTSSRASRVPTASHFDTFTEAWDLAQLRARTCGRASSSRRPWWSASTVLSILAGYAFGTMRFRGSNVLFYVLLLGLILPFEAVDHPAVLRLRRRRPHRHLLGADPPADRARRSRSARSGCARSSARCRGRCSRRRGSTAPQACARCCAVPLPPGRPAVLTLGRAACSCARGTSSCCRALQPRAPIGKTSPLARELAPARLDDPCRQRRVAPLRSAATVRAAVVSGTTRVARGAAGQLFHLGFWPDSPARPRSARSAARRLLHMLGLGPETSLLDRRSTADGAATRSELLHTLTRDGGSRWPSGALFAAGRLDEADAGDRVAARSSPCRAHAGRLARASAQRAAQLARRSARALRERPRTPVAAPALRAPVPRPRRRRRIQTSRRSRRAVCSRLDRVGPPGRRAAARPAPRRRAGGLTWLGSGSNDATKIYPGGVSRLSTTSTLEIGDGEFIVLVGPVGLRQVDAAADDRRPRGRDGGSIRDRRPRRHGASGRATATSRWSSRTTRCTRT